MKNQDEHSVGNLIAQIRNAAQPDHIVLRDLVRRANLVADDLLPYQTFDHAVALSYGRRCLWQGSHVGVYAMSWNPGDVTAIHNHGQAEFGIVFFAGTLAHRCYAVEGNTVTLTSTADAPSGSILSICTACFVHAMGNLGDAPIMTLHIYGAYGHSGPATAGAHVFELEHDRISTTGGSAYVNMPQTHRLTVTPGLTADDTTRRDYCRFVERFYARNGETLSSDAVGAGRFDAQP